LDRGQLKTVEDKDCEVLLIDDDDVIKEVLTHFLADEPMSLRWCPEGEEAVQRAIDVRPSVILLDMVMPRIDGLEVLQHLQANPETRDIPVVMLSSSDSTDLKCEAFALGASDYLVKLPPRVELIARLRAQTRSFRMQQERDEAVRALKATLLQLEAQNARLDQLSSLDGLTGIANRRVFDLALDERREMSSGELSMILIDVDEFKRYNDTCGHQAGDEVLRAIAQVLENCCRRRSDLVSRYGGEEFVALLPEVSLERAQDLAERMRLAITSLGIDHPGSDRAVVTASFGVAGCVGRFDERLFERADRALYAAKASGRNRVVVDGGEIIELYRRAQ